MGAGAVLSRTACTAKPPLLALSRNRTSESEIGIGPRNRTSDSEVGFGPRTLLVQPLGRAPSRRLDWQRLMAAPELPSVGPHEKLAALPGLCLVRGERVPAPDEDEIEVRPDG